MTFEKWTDEEDRRLIELADKYGFRTIAMMMPGRSYGSCIGRFNRLKKAGGLTEGVRRKVLRRRLRSPGAFTDEESLQMLHFIENERLSPSKAAKKMRRSTEAVSRHYRAVMRDLARSEGRS